MLGSSEHPMLGKREEKILSELEFGYDLIADKFSGTRAFMWRDLEFVKNMVGQEDIILDFGCGNGRLAGFFDNNYKEFVGVDISSKLIDVAKQKYSSEKTKFIKVFSLPKRSDRATKKESGRTAINLPLKDNYFDIVFSIAVFHHFPNRKYTLGVIEELRRVLRPNGKIVVTVWNLWQEQYLKYHQKTNKSWIDAIIPFKSGEKIFNRYHHPFRMGELESLFCKTGLKTLKTKEGWNLLYIGEKLSADE